VRIIGRKPKPRALIRGLDEEVAEQVKALFPTWREVRFLAEVDQQEWDVLVTNKTVDESHQSSSPAKPHLYVVAIGCESYFPWPGARLLGNFGRCRFPGENEANATVHWSWSVKATEFVVPANLPGPIERLVNQILLPGVRDRDDHKVAAPHDVSLLKDWPKVVHPFLLTTSRQCLAGKFTRAGSERAECWFLPDYMEEFASEWVQVALAEWYKLDSATFPSAAWVDLRRWRTPAENQLTGQLEQLRASRSEFLARSEAEEQAVLAKLGDAKQAAESHERILLTGARKELVAAVASCLSDLGFKVKDMDEVYPAGDLREDLQVRNPDVAGWVALAEVRGYRGGGQIRDLQRLDRFRRRYMRDHGEDVDRAWYVVNQFKEDDPESRPPVLASNEPELMEFADDGGLALDTADLFQLWMAVREGRLDRSDARRQLMEITGRFVLPSQAVDNGNENAG
jgi:hypothetical protein